MSRPLVWDGLHQGLIDRTRAVKIVHLLAEVPDPAREHLEARAIAYGAEHTTAQLHRYLLRLTCDHDPDETLRKQALDNRGVALIPARARHDQHLHRHLRRTGRRVHPRPRTSTRTPTTRTPTTKARTAAWSSAAPTPWSG